MEMYGRGMAIRHVFKDLKHDKAREAELWNRVF